MIGEKDTAYGRMDRCKAYDEKLKALKGDRADIFPYEMEFIPNHGHGGLPDRDKIKSMYANVRNVTPRELTWEMTDSVVHDFFWLRCQESAKQKSIDATLKENRLEVTLTNVDQAQALVDSRLVDFDKPLQLVVNGQASEAPIQPSLNTLCKTLSVRGDIDLAFTCEVPLEVSVGSANEQK
jgi:hypothetical protein